MSAELSRKCIDSIAKVSDSRIDPRWYRVAVDRTAGSMSSPKARGATGKSTDKRRAASGLRLSRRVRPSLTSGLAYVAGIAAGGHAARRHCERV